ncbi:hypothetical protein Q7C36_019133 [Tachysurus vachellii]|uniref:Uncharacterized protein n=1 Tax=Tachysurus vachellii TaxID=175792 RepID=A0AA88LVS4_TACVA|nr:hypothetical protein Q7C36_019133 [Tachysurus vachellii]
MCRHKRNSSDITSGGSAMISSLQESSPSAKVKSSYQPCCSCLTSRPTHNATRHNTTRKREMERSGKELTQADLQRAKREYERRKKWGNNDKIKDYNKNTKAHENQTQ